MPLSEAQRRVLSRWKEGSGAPCWAVRTVDGKQWHRVVAQLVQKGFLRTQSTLPYAGRQRSRMVLVLTDAGRAALREGGDD